MQSIYSHSRGISIFWLCTCLFLILAFSTTPSNCLFGAQTFESTIQLVECTTLPRSDRAGFSSAQWKNSASGLSPLNHFEVVQALLRSNRKKIYIYIYIYIMYMYIHYILHDVHMLPPSAILTRNFRSLEAWSVKIEMWSFKFDFFSATSTD